MILLKSSYVAGIKIIFCNTQVSIAKIAIDSCILRAMYYKLLNELLFIKHILYDFRWQLNLKLLSIAIKSDFISNHIVLNAQLWRSLYKFCYGIFTAQTK